MKVRTVFDCTGAAAVAALGVLAAEPTASRYDSGFMRPDGDWINVVLIMMDQTPAAALGCYGNAQAKTPNLDSLAHDGVLVRNAYSQHPTCVPSRATQLTGLYPSNHGLLSNAGNLELMHPWARVLPDEFSDGGYITGQFGKWHGGREARLCRWDEFKFMEDSIPIWPTTALEDVATLYCDTGGILAGTHPCSEDKTGIAQITDESLSFIERFAYKPFFLRVSYMGTHPPVLPPKPWDTLYNPEDIVLPDFDPAEYAVRPEQMQKERDAKILPTVNGGRAMTEADVREHIASMLGYLAYHDHQIGRILKKLDEMELRDRTLIVFTTDHGAWWGEYGMIKKSGVSLYRNLLQLPLLFSMPGTVPAGHEVAGFIENADLMPTLLDFAGLDIPERMNGRSMKKAVLGDESVTRDDVFAEAEERGYHVASLRTREWNLIWHSTVQEAELYHWSADPHERFNLADDPQYQTVIQELMPRLMSRMATAKLLMAPPREEATRGLIYWAPGQNATENLKKTKENFYGE